MRCCMKMIGEHRTVLLVIFIVLLSLIFGLNQLDINGQECVTSNTFYEATAPPPDPVVVPDTPSGYPGPINLALVSCDGVYNEAVVMIKSALMYSRKMIHIHIFADENNQVQIKKQLGQFPRDIQAKFEYRLYDIVLPQKPSRKEWDSCFAPGATQRLFFPELLPHVDRLVYVDTDMLFLGPIDELWDEFEKFNSAQIAGLSWHDEDDTIRTYGGEFPFPVYKPNGLNSGTVLMDLPRMRAANWSELFIENFMTYKDKLIFCDQDLYNIFFYSRPELLFKVDCKYNYRFGYCKWDFVTCLTAANDGVHILHGNPSVFREKKPLSEGFKAISEFYESYDFGQPYDTQLQRTLDELHNMTRVQEQCRPSIDFITKRMIGART